MPDVFEATLENGLTVLIRERRTAPVVSVWAGYRVGARNERPGITGASHWVEHMTFRGTTRLGKGDIFRLTARHGGNNNGFTSDDFTIYYETLPSAQLDVALMIESERMARALFDPAETESERTVILAERAGAENNPHYLLGELMGQVVFRQHPYRWPILGTRDDLERLTCEELLAHYQTYYVPNNAVLVIAGDVDAEETLRRVRHFFEEIPPGPPPPPVATVEPPQEEDQQVELRRPGGNPYLQVAYHTPPAGHPDWYPLAMLDAVMSGAKGIGTGGGYMGRSARIYNALVETRLAVSAVSSFRLSRDPNVLSASLTPREDVDPKQAERALVATLEGAAERPPSDEELEKALRQAEAQLAYGRESVTGHAYALMLFQLLGHWSDLDRHVERLRKVTPGDVARVVARYLRPENRTAGWFIPTEAGATA